MNAMKNLKILALVLVCFLSFLGGGSSLRAETVETLARQAIVIDYDTGAVLLAKNADEKMPTSSMSKVLTAYVVFDALKKGKISLDDRMVVSEKAWSTQGSKMFVELGGQISVDDLVHGVIIQSGNDATIVLAEGLAGTEEAFADAMNKTAAELGMKNSHFTNASGLPDPQHYSTARDLAVLGRALVHDFPEYYKIYSEKEFVYNGIRQGNRNPLLYANVGGDGIKTGHTEDAGYGLIGSGVENGRRVVFVVNGLSSMKERAEEAVKLLTWGLRRFENKKLIKTGEPIEQANVVLGQKSTVPLVPGNDVTVTLPKLAGHNIKISVKYKSPLVAPLKKGQEAGRVIVEVPDLAPIEAPLLVGEDVAELGLFAKTVAKAKALALGH